MEILCFMSLFETAIQKTLNTKEHKKIMRIVNSNDKKHSED